ncbi:MAG: A/G-specific adenine glycosylase [Roseivirga sp.]
MAQLSLPYPANKPTEPLEKALFAPWLISWYQTNKRDLPWRATHDPYKIWLSEIILQQTRVAQGLPYYQRFIEKYPSVQDLARAEEEEVLRLWQGLGYYSRARNLHACARMIVSQLDGKFPNTYQKLLRLKGVGTYTAGAIASIAFKESVPVVDGNVYRVLARVFGIEEDITSTQGVKTFYALAQSLVPPKDADLYNQAIMEFGAMHCTPVKPQCKTCLFKEHCIALHTNKQYALPVKSKKVKIKQRFLHYLVLQCEGKLYMKQRKSQDIWAGLYDFYLIEEKQLKDFNQLEDDIVLLMHHYQLLTTSRPTLYKHLLTHRQLYVHFFQVQATPQFIQKAAPLLSQAGMSAFTLDQIQALPKPTLINNFLEKELYPLA